MAGISIDFSALEASFENHAPDISTFLDKETGEILVFRGTADEAGGEKTVGDIREKPERYILVEPVASREQYRMMERFIETVRIEPLKLQLADAIVGKGAFRRFKDAVGRHAEERKRWFAFRDVLLHRHVLEWLSQHQIEVQELPDWSLELPEPASAETIEAEVPSEDPPDDVPDLNQLRAYLQSWARSHGEEYRYLFGPAAFDRLAEDMTQEFSFYRRR